MDWETIGPWAGALGGGVIGLIGAAVGVWHSVRNAKGPRERAFVIRAAVACGLLVALFTAGLFLLPGPYKWLLVIPYVVILLVGIRAANRRQSRIRSDESDLND